MNRYLYKLHIWTGMVISIPVIMWTLSGILHPLMGHLKPEVAREFIPAAVIPADNIKINLKEALEKNHFDSIENFRIIKWEDEFYYQIRKPGEAVPVYISTSSGELLAQGDKKYTGHLAELFLGDSSAHIKEIKLITSFDSEYKSVNRLLPVYKVTFDREDQIRLYIETFGNRLATSVDQNRSTFLWIFGTFHTWDFLNNTGSFRLVILIILTMLTFFTACMGIINIIKMPRRKGKLKETRQKYKRYHRVIGIIACTPMLMFSFSGAYHAFSKFTPDDRQNFSANNIIKTSDLLLPLDSVFKSIDTSKQITNISVASLSKGDYYQIYLKSGRTPSPPVYLNVKDGKRLTDGNQKYARHLACTFSGLKDSDILYAEHITSFEGEYGFINKRLPVVKVGFNQNDNIRYYIETSSGKLAAKVQDSDYKEGLSFAFLHKYHFLDFLGKDARNIIMACCAFMVTLVTVLGIVLFIYWRKNLRS